MNATVDVDFSGRICALVEPTWLARQFRRVKPGDRGAARVLIQDDFPVRRRIALFELPRAGLWRVYVSTDGGADTQRGREIARALLRLDGGAFALSDERTLIEALAQWRRTDETISRLGALGWLEPGLYEFTFGADAESGDLFVSIRSSHEDGTDFENSESFDNPDALDGAAALAIEIGDELDLHLFSPRDARAVLEEYSHLAAAKGFDEVRIIHGKGVGEMRRLCRSVLAERPEVIEFFDAPPHRGGAGATIARLRSIQPEKG